MVCCPAGLAAGEPTPLSETSPPYAKEMVVPFKVLFVKVESELQM